MDGCTVRVTWNWQAWRDHECGEKSDGKVNGERGKEGSLRDKRRVG